MESQFFSQGIWKDFPRGLVGIDSLRQRLSKVLLEQTRTELPSLIAEIDSSVQDCRTRLAKLGDSRTEIGEQRLFLLKTSQAFQLLLKAATDGTYGDAFFGDPRSTKGYTKRLRAVIQNLNLSFAESMRKQGHRYHIVEKPDPSCASRTQQPEIITRAEYLKHVLELLKRSRGRELPGMSNPLIVGDLFHEQSQPWEALAREHLSAVCEATRTFLDLTVSYLANETASEAVLKELVDPLMEIKAKQMHDRLGELLAPYQAGHPIKYNHYFTETIQNVRRVVWKARSPRDSKKSSAIGKTLHYWN